MLCLQEAEAARRSVQLQEEQAQQRARHCAKVVAERAQQQLQAHAEQQQRRRQQAAALTRENTCHFYSGGCPTAFKQAPAEPQRGRSMGRLGRAGRGDQKPAAAGGGGGEEQA